MRGCEGRQRTSARPSTPPPRTPGTGTWSAPTSLSLHATPSYNTLTCALNTHSLILVEVVLFKRGRVPTAAAVLRFFMAAFAALMLVGFFTEASIATAIVVRKAGLASRPVCDQHKYRCFRSVRSPQPLPAHTL